ncbi:MAG: amidohydrolase [Xanthomonadales bacterium]|nr:amidohydrolase [Xanthomonadales bacterium]
MRLLLSIALLLSLPLQAQTLFHNARFHGPDPGQATATAMLVDAGGRIVALGTAEELDELAAGAARVDLGGAPVLPGLIDAHGHLLNLGMALMSADLVGADSKQEILARLQRFEARLPEGAWLTGRGWDQNRWPDATFPTAADLDAAFPGRPVWLRRIDGHAGWANSAALALATRDLSGDWQPDGGRILRDEEGLATGVFIDAAMALIGSAEPAPDEATRVRALELALAEASRLGLTGVHDAGVSLDTLRLLRRLADQDRLPLRVYAMADGDAEALDWLCREGRYRHPDGRLEMRSVKLYMDGALGSRGAALLRDYSDEAGNRGLLVTPRERIESAVAKAARCGIQANTHAIGDRGNRMVLDIYARVLEGSYGDSRFRIEHAQVVGAPDIPRFAELGVIASMQPIHATSDMPWAQARLGRDRLAGAYAWQRLAGAGTRLAFGSDFPVEPVNPWFGIHAAVTRQDAEGRPPGGWLPDQRVDLATALRGFTVDAAYAGFAEDEVGGLVPGRRADFIVLSDDPFSLPSARLRGVTVVSTWLDGRKVANADPLQ